MDPAVNRWPPVGSCGLFVPRQYSLALDIDRFHEMDVVFSTLTVCDRRVGIVEVIFVVDGRPG